MKLDDFRRMFAETQPENHNHKGIAAQKISIHALQSQLKSSVFGAYRTEEQNNIIKLNQIGPIPALAKGASWKHPLVGDLKCESCGSSPAAKIQSKTSYPWDGKSEDPNRDRVFCESCAREYEEHWDNMWAEYYSSMI